MALRWSTGASGLVAAIAAVVVALPGSALGAAATATAGDGVGASGAHTAIVGGSAAAPGTFPWLALVEYNEGNGEAQYCSGTVVSANVVLTAGHCVANIETAITLPAGGFTVFTGDVDWTAPAEQSSAVTEVLAYPGFDPTTGYGDAGLLVLATPTSEPAIPLATSSDDGFIQDRNAITIAGWGATSGGSGLSAALQSGILGVQSAGYCNSQDGADSLNFDPSSEFCAIDPMNYAIGTCHGDSGGPAIVTVPPAIGTTASTSSADVQEGYSLEVGIASRADAYCSTTVPDIFTRVDLVSGWVNGVIDAVALPAAPTTPAPRTPPATTTPTPVTSSAPPTPATGKYLGTTHQRDGHVNTTVEPGEVTRINVRFDLRCASGTRGPLTTTEVFTNPPKLKGVGRLWRFSTVYKDSLGRRYVITGIFSPSGAATKAIGTLEVTTKSRRCTSGTVHWSAPAPAA